MVGSRTDAELSAFTTRKDTMLTEKPFLTAAEAASLLGVSRIQSIYTWLKTGQLPALRVGRLWRISTQDLLNTIQKRPAPHGTTTTPQSPTS